MLRQPRVGISSTARGRIEPVRGDHHHVGCGVAQAFERVGRLEGGGLVERYRARRGRLRDRARAEAQAAPRGTIGLREYERDFVAGGDDRLEGPRREGGRAREDYAHGRIAEIRPPCADAS